MKKNFGVVALSVGLSVVASAVTVKLLDHGGGRTETVPEERIVEKQTVIQKGGVPDFAYAAENSVEGVVFVKVVKREKIRELSILQYFFGYESPYARERESVNSGSGVIITPDGYIATNNHVVAGGVDIEVTLNNNRTYKASLVGADPVTDVALLKIEEQGLPVIPFGDSDALRLGQWVLAIGSPFNLRSTITAGIVSAKGRSLPDGSGQFKIESFIQTDAAVNPGNSGGALVNAQGELVGINTAIASNTGSYTGYSFAVPVSIVKKVVDDIRRYGSVQRALLGISMIEVNQELRLAAGLPKDLTGVFVADILSGGAAQESGMKLRDVLVSLAGKSVKTPSEVQEAIAAHAPGDVVAATVYREGKNVELQITLKGNGLNEYRVKTK